MCDYKRDFELQGKVIGFKKKRTGAWCTIAVNHINQKTVFPHVFIPATAKGYDESIMLRPAVHLKGHIDCKVKMEIDTKKKYEQTLIVDEILPGETEMDGGAYLKAPYFKADIVGTLVAIADKGEDWAVVIIRVKGEEYRGEAKTIALSYYKKNKLLPDISRIENGKDYRVYARISTPKKEVNGVTRSFNTLVCCDMVEVA